MQNANLKIKNLFVLFCLLPLAFSLFGCSIPNLEAPECTRARAAAKDFYSYHFGNDMKFTPENLKPREHFLSPELNELLQKFVTESDPFTLTDNQPKAFSIAACEVKTPEKADVQVYLFWRNDNTSAQKTIHAEVVKQGDKWLIDNIYNEQANLRNLKH